jgi:hypothetical protein
LRSRSMYTWRRRAGPLRRSRFASRRTHALGLGGGALDQQARGVRQRIAPQASAEDQAIRAVWSKDRLRSRKWPTAHKVRVSYNCADDLSVQLLMIRRSDNRASGKCQGRWGQNAAYNFTAKAADVVGLYIASPEKAIVLPAAVEAVTDAFPRAVPRVLGTNYGTASDRQVQVQMFNARAQPRQSLRALSDRIRAK